MGFLTPRRYDLQPICWGLPRLGAFHQAKVDSANKLYSLGFQIAIYCLKYDIALSIEKPANSWLWAVFIWFTLQTTAEVAMLWNTLEMVQFQSCCHGSLRRKHAGWLSTPGIFSSLTATCDGNHNHAPWGISWVDGIWVFDASSEAAYPPLLAQRATACFVKHVLARGWSLVPQPKLHDFSYGVANRPANIKPLVPEHHQVKLLPSTASIPEGAKVLRMARRQRQMTNK